MKLFLLRPYSGDDSFVGFEEARGFVVRAKDEESARRIASLDRGNEGPLFWRDKKLSTCVELDNDGEEGVIIRDYING